jgi:FkbM family methyltransferase
MLKAAIRPILNRVIVRERFNDSPLYAAYISVFRPKSAEAWKQEFRFYEALLGRGLDLIFDIGSSGGHKTNIFRQFAHRVVCAEPGPKAVEMLTRRFRHDPRITVLAKAVGDIEGPAELRVFRDAEPCNTVSVKDNDRDGQLVTIEMTTLDRMIEQFGRPYHIKISVNGSEAAVFRGLNRQTGSDYQLCVQPN